MTGLHTLALPAGASPRATLVALPGLIESAEAMRPTLLHWAGRGFDVLAVDPRGHAISPRWTDDLLGRHPGDVIVDDVLATLAAAPINPDLPLVLFGHSAGGGAAAAVAAALSDRVRAVVLEDPFWRLPVTQFQDQAVAVGAEQDLQRLKGLSQAERLAEITAIFPQWPDDELAAWAQAKDDMDISVVANGHVIPSRGWPTLLHDLHQAGIAVLVVTGTVRIGMTANHRAMIRAAGAEVVVVRGATHFIRRDGRDQFHALTDAFLDRHLTGGPVQDTDSNQRTTWLKPRNLQPLGGPSWPV